MDLYLIRHADAAPAGPDGNDLARQALGGFGLFLAEEAQLRERVVNGDLDAALDRFETSPAFTVLVDALHQAQAAEQAVFDARIEAAADATAPLKGVNTLAAGSILALVLAGLYLRLREYRS